MNTLIDRVKAHWEVQDGFAMPVVLLQLVVMTTIAVAALTTASDEQKSAQAVREAGLAFYDAEAGLWESWANWPADSIVTAIEQGDSLDLGWKSLDNGAEYRGQINRWGPTMYGLTVESRGAGPLGGQQWLSLLISGEGASMSIGRCCDAAALVDGDVRLDQDEDFISGHDTHPEGWGDWEDEEDEEGEGGVCTNGLEDVPGLIMKDMDQLDQQDGIVDGVPPLVEDTTISESTFSDFGDKTWEDLKAWANFIVDEYDLTPEPSYINNDEDCDTSDRFNWGSPDADDPCFDYFPIILIQDQVHAEAGYGQGILILDWDVGSSLGSEIDLEDGMVFNGIILGKGCLEIQRGSQMNGAVFMDGNYFNDDLCDPDKVLDVKEEGGLQCSSCAIERAIRLSGLDDFGEGGEGSGYSLLASRAFAQLPR